MSRQITMEQLLVFEALEESKKIQYEEIRRRLRIYETKKAGAPAAYVRDVQFLLDQLREFLPASDRRRR